MDSLVADSQVNVTFYVQVCQNIKFPPPGCKDVGAAYSVTSDGKCQSWGDANVAIFDANPYKDGKKNDSCVCVLFISGMKSNCDSINFIGIF